MYGLPYRFMYGFDGTYILVLIGVILTLLAQAKMQSTFSKYSKIRSTSGMNGAGVARRILDMNGLGDVEVNHVSGNLTDHYNPANRTVNLSDATYNSYSIAAVSVAAHECGHAIQHSKNYAPLSFRTAIFPLANIGSNLAWPIIIIGVILGGMGNIMIQLGIIMFSLAVLFQFVTLPVEFDASTRALVKLNEDGILPFDEESAAKKVLFAAALTYVAAAASSVLQLLRLVLLFGGRRND